MFDLSTDLWLISYVLPGHFPYVFLDPSSEPHPLLTGSSATKADLRSHRQTGREKGAKRHTHTHTHTHFTPGDRSDTSGQPAQAYGPSYGYGLRILYIEGK